MAITNSDTLRRGGKKAKAEAVEEKPATKTFRDITLSQLREMRRGELLKVAEEAGLTIGDLPANLLSHALAIKLEL